MKLANIFQRERSITLEKYFELVKPKYRVVEITSHKSIRNYNSSNIAKNIAYTYRSINKRIRFEQKKLFFETSFKISYCIDIQNNNAKFYFIVPQVFLNGLLEKINEIWAKATVTVLEEGLKPFSKEAEYYQLSYKKEDALSLNVDRKTNDPLNSILSVMEIMKDDDRIMLFYNFLPCSQLGWLDRYTETVEKLREKKPIERKQVSFEYIVRAGILGMLKVFDDVLKVINDFTGGSSTDDSKSLYNTIWRVLEQQQELTRTTQNKKNATVINTQVAVISESKDQVRKTSNAVSVCQAFRTIDEDNELIYKKMKNSFDFNQTDIKADYNTFSSEECSNFIQIPARQLLTQYKIDYIKTQENSVPKELSIGTKRLGEVTVRGNRESAFLENEYNNGNLPLTLIGSQGGGKTTYIANYASDCVKTSESVIIIDFIKNCELSEDVKKIVPVNKVIDIDLGSEDGIQGLGYNEIVIEEEYSNFEKLKLASLQSQQVMSLVDAVSVGDPLSSRMRRFLNAAAQVVFVQGYNSLKNVVDCLENHKKRQLYIKGLNEVLYANLEDEINTLYELDEWSRGSKATKTSEGIEPEVIGTNTGKIEHILDRIGILREDFKLKYMYNKSLENNFNLVDVMEQGKVLLIKMRESDFPTKMQKNLLVTYWVSKIWLASQLRGMKNSKPLRCNVIIDEVFQAPTCMNTLEYILPQSRKFGCKFVFSTQYIKQLDKIFDTLEASGSSFMMLTGSTEDDFNHFKGKIDEFEYEDLRDMEKFHSLNLIKYSGGYASFITKLPKPI